VTREHDDHFTIRVPHVHMRRFMFPWGEKDHDAKAITAKNGGHKES
jgi:hypothetical protein